MHEIGQRTHDECRVLEVGMGTGYFTRWLAEVSAPGTAIFAFDYSWPMIEKAKANTSEMSAVTLFRANAREKLPFRGGDFDIVYLQSAPLGPHGVSRIEAGYELLKPGGWYVSVGGRAGLYNHGYIFD
jgi:SAM-dependent methyltransferase